DVELASAHRLRDRATAANELGRDLESILLEELLFDGDPQRRHGTANRRVGDGQLLQRPRRRGGERGRGGRAPRGGDGRRGWRRGAAAGRAGGHQDESRERHHEYAWRLASFHRRSLAAVVFFRMGSSTGAPMRADPGSQYDTQPPFWVSSLPRVPDR